MVPSTQEEEEEAEDVVVPQVPPGREEDDDGDHVVPHLPASVAENNNVLRTHFSQHNNDFLSAANTSPAAGDDKPTGEPASAPLPPDEQLPRSSANAPAPDHDGAAGAPPPAGNAPRPVALFSIKICVDGVVFL